MQGRRVLLVLGVLPLAAAAMLIVGAPAASSGSTALHGRMLDITNFPCASATGVCSSFTATGSIKGEGTVFVDTFPTSDGISKAHTVIETRKGNLTCTEIAVFDLVRADHPFVDLCIITGGTGIYEGATGYIQEAGTFDFAANRGQLEYTGKLERARD